MSALTLMTFEQFEKLPDDGFRHELLKGQHIVSTPDTIRRSNVRHAIYHLLRPQVFEHQLGEMYIAAGFLLSPDTFLLPAGSLVRTAQLKTTDPDGYFEGSPAIAIEVASESHTAAQLDLKMEQFFAHGAEEVWVVYPETKKIRMHYPDGRSKTATKELRSDLFPELAVPLDAIFQS